MVGSPAVRKVEGDIVEFHHFFEADTPVSLRSSDGLGVGEYKFLAIKHEQSLLLLLGPGVDQIGEYSIALICNLWAIERGTSNRQEASIIGGGSLVVSDSPTRKTAILYDSFQSRSRAISDMEKPDVLNELEAALHMNVRVQRHYGPLLRAAR